MLEGFVSQLLADYLSTYVKGVQPDQIRVGLWNGVVLLENVELQLEAFDYLQLPFVIKQGVVGKLKLQVPWKKLGWEPLLIVLEDVFLCPYTPDEFEWNPNAIEARALAAKKAKLAAAELGKLSAHLSQSLDNNSGQSFWSYLSAKIIGNIQITVKHLHVQYVHQVTDSELTFFFGVTFTSLTVCTDESSNRSISAGSLLGRNMKGSMVHKLVEIQNLALYWNTTEKPASGHVQNSNRDAFKSKLFEECNEMNYILRPVDVSLQLLVSKTQAFDVTSPQCALIFDINNVDLILDNFHLCQMVLLWDALFICRLREKYGCFRPLVGQPGYDRRKKGWQKAWWKYAIKSVVSDVNRKLRYTSWSYLSWRMDICRQYVPLYKSKLECLLQHQPISDEKLQILEKLERELDLEEILSFRSRAEKQIHLENVIPMKAENSAPGNVISTSLGQQQVEDQPSRKQRSWLNLLSRGILGAAGSKVCEQFTGFIPDEMIEDIYEATSYHPIRSSSFGESTNGYCRAVGTIKLNSINLVLRNLNPMRDFVSVVLHGFDASLKLWPQSVSISVTLEAAKAVDLVSNCLVLQSMIKDEDERRAHRCEVASSANSAQMDFTLGASYEAAEQPMIDDGTARMQFVVADLELFPVNSDCDLIVKAVIQPLEFIYTSAIVMCLEVFFSSLGCLSIQQKLAGSPLNVLENFEIGISSKSEKRISWKLSIERAVLLFPGSMEKCSALTSVCLVGLEMVPKEWQGDVTFVSTTAGYQSYHKAVKYKKMFGLYELFQLQAHNIKICLDGGTSIKSIYQQVTGHLDDALLKFIQFDCHQELQIKIKCLCIEKTPNECAEVSSLPHPNRTHLVLSGSSLCLSLSEKYISQGDELVAYSLEETPSIREKTGATVPAFSGKDTPPSVEAVEWGCVVDHMSLMPRSAAGKEQDTIAKSDCVKFHGLIRAGFLEYLKVEAPKLELLILESCANDFPSRELLKCTSVGDVCNALEISLTSTSTGTMKISIFISVVEVILLFSLWVNVARTISSLMYSFSCSTDGQFIAEGCESSGYSNSSHVGNGVSLQSGSGCHDQITGGVSFSISFLDISFILPDLVVGEEELSATARSALGFHMYVNQGWKRRSIKMKAAIQIEELAYNESRLILKAKSSMCECFLRDSYDEGDQGLLFLQIMQMGIEGNFYLQDCKSLCSQVRAQVHKLDAWFSHATLCFLKSFCFERVEPGFDSVLVVELDISASVQHVSVLLIDGRWSCQLPMFQLLSENFVTHLAIQQDIMDISITCQIEADYQNIEKVLWEPLLEPGNISILLRRTCPSVGAISRVYYTSTKIISCNQLNFNVTSSLSQAIVYAIEMLQDALKTQFTSEHSKPNDDHTRTKEKKIMRHYAPYWLQNDCGVVIRYWLIIPCKSEDGTNPEGNRSIACEMKTRAENIVQPGCSSPLYIEENPMELACRNKRAYLSEQQADKRPYDRRHRMICVQLEGTVKPSIPMSIDLVGSRSFDVVFSQSMGSSQEDEMGDQLLQEEKKTDDGCSEERYNGFSTPVVFEVSFQQYSKLVRIYSTVTLVNATSIPLEVRFDIPFGISPKIMDPMLAGQVTPLPVHLAETGQIRLRPIDSGHLWSESQSLSNILLPEYRSGCFRSVVCYPIHHSKAAFRFCITVRETCIPAASIQCFPTEKGNESAPIRGKAIKYNLQKTKSLNSGSIKCFNAKHVVREIILQAPLVFNNGLPLSLSVIIDTGIGPSISASAQEGNALFILEVNPMHELSMKLNISGYLPCSLKVARPVIPSSGCKGASLYCERISFTETIALNAENPSGFPVITKVVKVLDSASGARELYIFAPFWLYNLTGMDLAITDGEIDEACESNELLMPLPNGGLSSKSDDLSRLQQGVLVTGFQTILEIKETDKLQDHGCLNFPQQKDKFRRNILQTKLFKCTYQNTDASDYWTPTWHRPSERAIRYTTENSLLGLEKKDKAIFHNVEASFPKACIYSPLKNDLAGDKKIRVRVVVPHLVKDNSQEQNSRVWSRPFLINPPGGLVTVVVPHAVGKGAYLFSVLSASCLGACSDKTTTVTFRPRFLLANACQQDLCYKQHGTEKFRRISSGHQSHLHWSDKTMELLLSIRFDDHGWDWSGCFIPDQLGDTQLKVRNYVTGVTEIVRVEVQSARLVNGGENDISSPDNSLGTNLIILSNDETGFMPYRIDNLSKERMKFYQQKCEKYENTLLPYSSCSYAWDEPLKPHRIIVEIPGEGHLGIFQMEETKNYPDVHLSAQKHEKKFSISVLAEGPIKVLKIHDMSLRLASDLNGIHTDDIDECRNGSRQVEDCYAHCTDEVVFKLSSVGLSIIDSSPKEIVFVCARGIHLYLLQGAQQQQLRLHVSSFQIDNQLRHAQYPVMMSSGNNLNDSFPPLDLGAAQCWKEWPTYFTGEAALDVLIMKWRHLLSSVDCFQNVTIRIAPVYMQLEEHVICSLLCFSRSIFSYPSLLKSGNPISDMLSSGMSCDSGPDSVDNFISKYNRWKKNSFFLDSISSVSRYVNFMKHMEYRSRPSQMAVEFVENQAEKLFILARRSRKVHIELLEIAPVDLTVSFSSLPWLPKEDHVADAQSLLGITGSSVQRSLMALVDIERVPVHFRRVKLTQPLASWDTIRNTLLRNYTRQLLHEVYKIVGSVGAFGNPMGVIRSLGNGVCDFLSLPARSFKKNPKFLARGISQGTRSLVNNTVFALSNAAAQMSKAAWKGVTAFTLDDKCIAGVERKEREDFQENGVLNELLEGLTGLLQSPVVGAEKHGVPGILSGVAGGAVRLVARPMASVLEVAGRTAQSIRIWSQPTNQLHETRIRPPRHLNADGVLLPYSLEVAVGNAILEEAVNNYLKAEKYVICKPMSQPGRYVLVTKTLLLKVRSASLMALAGDSRSAVGPKWNIDLEIRLSDVLYIDMDRCVLNILLGSPRCPTTRLRTSRPSFHTRPFLHESIEMASEAAAKELSCVLRILVDEQSKGKPQIIAATRM